MDLNVDIKVFRRSLVMQLDLNQLAIALTDKVIELNNRNVALEESFDQVLADALAEDAIEDQAEIAAKVAETREQLEQQFAESEAMEEAEEAATVESLVNKLNANGLNLFPQEPDTEPVDDSGEDTEPMEPESEAPAGGA
jgi:hypothetical protein